MTVVSKSDVSAAIESLTDSLQDKAKKELEQKTDNNSKSLAIITNTSFTESNLDKKIDTEASNFTLSGTVIYESLSYQEQDIQDFVKSILAKNADPKLTQGDTTYELQDVTETKKIITGTLLAKTFLVPLIDKEKTIQAVTGKSFAEAKTMLLQIPQTSDVSITLRPNMPFLPTILPKFSNHITIRTENE